MRTFKRRPLFTRHRPWYEIPGKEGCCVGAWQPQYAPSEAQARWALDTNAGPVTQAAPLSLPSWSPGVGWIFATDYWRTDIYPAVNGWSAIVKFSNVTDVNGSLFGFHSSATCRMNIQPNEFGKRQYRNGGSFNVAGVQTSGCMAVCNQTAYLNGLFDGNLAGAQAGASTWMQIARCNGALASECDCYIQAFAVYNVTLSAAEVWELTMRMNHLDNPLWNYWSTQRTWWFMPVPTVTPRGRILWTFDGGYTWIPLDAPDNAGLSHAFASSQTLLHTVGPVSGTTPVILKTEQN